MSKFRWSWIHLPSALSEFLSRETWVTLLAHFFHGSMFHSDGLTADFKACKSPRMPFAWCFEWARSICTQTNSQIDTTAQGVRAGRKDEGSVGAGGSEWVTGATHHSPNLPWQHTCRRDAERDWRVPHFNTPIEPVPSVRDAHTVWAHTHGNKPTHLDIINTRKIKENVEREIFLCSVICQNVCDGLPVWCCWPKAVLIKRNGPINTKKRQLFIHFFTILSVILDWTPTRVSVDVCPHTKEQQYYVVC